MQRQNPKVLMQTRQTVDCDEFYQILTRFLQQSTDYFATLLQNMMQMKEVKLIIINNILFLTLNVKYKSYIDATNMLGLTIIFSIAFTLIS